MGCGLDCQCKIAKLNDNHNIDTMENVIVQNLSPNTYLFVSLSTSTFSPLLITTEFYITHRDMHTYMHACTHTLLLRVSPGSQQLVCCPLIAANDCLTLQVMTVFPHALISDQMMAVLKLEVLIVNVSQSKVEYQRMMQLLLSCPMKLRVFKF